MPWVKLDDQFPHHPRIVKAGDMAAWLYVAGLCYAGQFLTDGVIPKGQLRRLTNLSRPEKEALRLVDVGLWHDKDDHYEIHDYHQWNPPAAKVKAKREADRVRKESARNPQGQDEESPRNPDVRSSSDPTYLLTSSSSEPCVGDDAEEEEISKEAQRRLRDRKSDERIVSVKRWLEKTKAGIREERAEARAKEAEAQERKNRAAACLRCEQGWLTLEDGTLARCDHKESA